MPKMFLTSHYSDRIVILIPSHTTLLTNTGQDAIASASVLHRIDYQPWSGVCPGNSVGESKLLGLRGSALFSKILLFERSEFRILGNGFSRSTES